jgi:D-amino peptidase
LKRILLVLVALIAATANAQKPKIFISADMEGVAGAVTGEQLGPTGFEYQRFREFMTQEVNAAIKAARDAGAGEIVVADSHGNAQNLLIEKLPADVTIVRSWPRPLGMMEGIDETFAGAIFIGYHTATTNPEGVRAHTISSARFADVRLNGRSMPESGLNAAIAGQFGVPVLMISGDDQVAKEAQALLTPDASSALIAEKVKRAMSRLSDFKPYRVSKPVTLEVQFKNYRPSEILNYLRIVERPDAHTIRFVGSDLVEVSKFLQFINNYEPGLEP